MGDAVCIRCHAEIGESYREHPMGRSLSRITPASARTVENTAGAPLFSAGGLQYSIENRNGHVTHLETRRAASGGIVAQNAAEVQFTLGSGSQDDCIGCHLPRSRTSDVFHGATTDHRIPRRAAEADRSPAIDRQPQVGKGRVVVFHRDLMGERERAAAGREIGMALARSYQWSESAAAALPLLEAALAARPDDVAAWECKGVALARLGRHEQSQAAFQSALAREPNRESALADAADFADAAGRHSDAIAYWRRVIAISPWRAEYHGRLAFALFQARDWREAANECRVALRLSPVDLLARELLIRCELRLKDHEAALKEFQALLEFDPPNRAELMRRFTTLSPPGGGGP